MQKELNKLEEEKARLKAEVERSRDQYNGIIDTQLKVIEELKAEVERLTSDLQMEKENEDRLVRLHQKANNEVYGLQSQVAALIDDQTRLKAEVERLTKAGDAMEMTLQADFNGCPYEPTIVREAMIYWRTAKQGGQP